MNKDIKSIWKSNNIFIFANKTRNFYETSKENYNKLFTQNITKTYRKNTIKMYININKEAKAIASKYEISERVNCLPMTDVFISLKDHKSNFTTNRKCRLINPSKNEWDKSLVNHLSDTCPVINWFENIDHKSNCIFMQFDIKEFYRSISKVLLMKGINHTKSIVTISKEAARGE